MGKFRIERPPMGGLSVSQTREPQRLQTSHGQQFLELLTVEIDGHTANDDAVPQVRHRLHLAGRRADGAAILKARLIGRRRIVLHSACDRNRGDQSQGTGSGEKAFRSVGYHLNYLGARLNRIYILAPIRASTEYRPPPRMT